MIQNSQAKIYLRIKPTDENAELIESFKLVNDQHICYKNLYAFDKIFNGSISQQQVYNTAVKQLCDYAINGFNCAVIVYGQTNTGKTFTMEGNTENPGIVAQSLETLFGSIQQLSQACISIYNENLIDLLEKENKGLKLYEDSEKQQTCVLNSTSIICDSFEVAMLYYQQGNTNRFKANTTSNARSSRSHSVFHVRLLKSESHVISNFYFVDLAGNEKLFKRGETNKNALTESLSINQSLLYFSKVIQVLAEEKQNKYIPYRNSVLTRLLKSSLNLSSHICLICHISLLKKNEHETYSTIKFAHTAANIKINPSLNYILKSVKEAKNLDCMRRSKLICHVNTSINVESVNQIYAKKEILKRKTVELKSVLLSLKQETCYMLQL